MSADVNLSSDDMRVECLLDRFEQAKTAVTPSRMGLTPGLVFDMSRTCCDLDVQANAEHMCNYLRTERPVLSVGSPKCKAFMDLRSMDRPDPKFSKNLEAPEVVDGNLSLAERAGSMVSA